MTISENATLSVNDYVILLNSKAGIQARSVGIIRSINDNNHLVFFIGKQIELLVQKKEINHIDLSKTGKPHKYKVCNVCHLLKDYYQDFEINQTDAQGRKTTRPSCRDCRKNIDGVGLTTDERKRLEKVKPKDFFICPICEKGSIPGITANLVKDHDHKTGKARDWLCDSCNTGLGRFKDDIILLRKAISYLEKHQDKAI